MTTEDTLLKPQQKVSPKTGPTITLNSHVLSKAGIDLVSHKIRPSDLGVDATFAVETWSF